MATSKDIASLGLSPETTALLHEGVLEGKGERMSFFVLDVCASSLTTTPRTHDRVLRGGHREQRMHGDVGELGGRVFYMHGRVCARLQDTEGGMVRSSPPPVPFLGRVPRRIVTSALTLLSSPPRATTMRCGLHYIRVERGKQDSRGLRPAHIEDDDQGR